MIFSYSEELVEIFEEFLRLPHAELKFLKEILIRVLLEASAKLYF